MTSHERAATIIRRVSPSFRPTCSPASRVTQEPAVQVLLRRSRLAAVRPDLRARRSITRPAPSSPSCARTPREMAALIGPRACWSSSAAAAAPRRACCSTHLRDLAAYVPVDISPRAPARSRRASSRATTRAFAVAARLRRLHRAVRASRRRGSRARTVVYFPGSTIGNFEPPEAAAFPRARGRALPARRRAAHRRRPEEGPAHPRSAPTTTPTA